MYARDPSFDACRAELDKSAFQTLLDLANEAVITATRLRQMVQAGHPLRDTLSGMSSSEALTYLLGLTHKSMEQPIYLSSDKTPSMSSDNKGRSLSIQEKTEVRQDRPLGPRSDTSPSMVLELDDDTFDAFSSFEVTQV